MPEKDINLLSKEEFENKPIGKFLSWALTAGKWITIIVELMIIGAFLFRFKLDNDLGNLNQSIREKQAIIENDSAFEKDFRQVQQRIITIQKLEKDQTKILETLSSISNTIPSGVILINLSMDKKICNLKGSALSESALGYLINNISSSPKFTNTTIGNVTKDIELDNGINFNLTTEIK